MRFGIRKVKDNTSILCRFLDGVIQFIFVLTLSFMETQNFRAIYENLRNLQNFRTIFFFGLFRNDYL